MNITDTTSQELADNAKLIYRLSAKFVERANALGLKGKRRDDDAITYFCGAAQMADLTGQTALCSTLATLLGLVISTRGYKEIEHMAKLAPAEGKEG